MSKKLIGKEAKVTLKLGNKSISMPLGKVRDLSIVVNKPTITEKKRAKRIRNLYAGVERSFTTEQLSNTITELPWAESGDPVYNYSLPVRPRYVNPDYVLRHHECGGRYITTVTGDSINLPRFIHHCERCQSLRISNEINPRMYEGFDLPPKPLPVPPEIAASPSYWARTENVISEHVAKIAGVTLFNPYVYIKPRRQYTCNNPWLVLSWNLFKVMSYVDGIAQELGPYWEFMQFRLDQWIEANGPW